MLSPGAGAPLPSPTVPSAAAPHGSGSDREERRRREAREEEDTARESERQRIPQPLRVKEKGVSIDKEVWRRRNQKAVVGIKRRVVECCDLTQAALSSCKRFWTSCVQQAGVVLVESSPPSSFFLSSCVSPCCQWCRGVEPSSASSRVFHDFFFGVPPCLPVPRPRLCVCVCVQLLEQQPFASFFSSFEDR